MAGAPVFQSELRLPEAPTAGLQPLPLPPSGGIEQIGAAIEKFGEAGAQFAEKLRSSQEHTKVAVATTNYLTRLNELEQTYSESKDYENATKDFARDRGELETTNLGAISDPLLRTRAQLEFRRAGLASEKRVRDKAVATEADVNTAALDAQELENLRSAASGSPVERAAAVDRNGKAVDAAAQSSWISEQGAQARKTRFAKLLENNDAMAIIRDDPKRFLELVKDPKNFPTLDPVTRQSYISGATAASDDRAIAGVVNRARFKPEVASLELGHVISAQHADAIFSAGVIPQESGGRADAVSPKGALGLTQVMPDTAREMLRKMGRADLAGLPEPELKQKLLEDKDLNYRVGQSYFREQLTRYEGNVPLALAAYNAGPKRADEWKFLAEQKFGAGFTPAQLVSVIGIDETRNYVTDIYGRLGARMEGAGVSQAGIFRAASQVGGELQTQINAQDHVARTLAATGRQTDNIVDIYKSGYNVDPARETAFRQTQQRAAERGDLNAVQALRDLDEAKGMAPYHRAAWGLPPVRLEAAVAEMEAATAASPNVSGEAVRQLKAFRAVRDEIRIKRNEPISLGEAAGLFVPVAIDPAAQPNDPKFARALAARGQQAIAAAAVYQGAVNPFRPDEMAALKERWANAQEGERFALIDTMARNMPERAYRAALAQIGGDDGTTLTAGLFAPSRPDLARQILHGAALLKTPDIEKKADPVRQALKAKMPGEMYPSPDMQTDVVQAALAVYTSQRGAAGALYDAGDSAAIERAIEQVTGPIARRNGQSVPVPPGMTKSQFSDVMERLDKDTLAGAGGAFDRNGRPFQPDFIGGRALLKPLQVGGSRYAVLAPTADGRGAPILNAEGYPLVVDVRELAAAVKPRELTPAQRGRATFRAGQAAELEAERLRSEQAP